jgi:DoxX-like family
MQPNTQVAAVSNKTLCAGRIISALPVVFLLVDGAMKVMKAPVAVEGSIQLGYPEKVVVALGVVLLICTLLYVIPQTSILGAILLTGYLGGAIATHMRVGNPLFTMSCSPSMSV